MPLLGTVASSQAKANVGLTFIASTTLASDQGSVTLNNLGSYDDLMVLYLARASTNTSDTSMNFNGTTSSNYATKLHYSADGGYGAESNTQTAGFYRMGYTAFNTSTANAYGTTQLYIPAYRSSHAKPIMWYSGGFYGASVQDATALGLWSNTAAVTSLVFSGSFAAGTQFWVYGIKKAI